MKSVFTLVAVVSLAGCSSIFRPYPCGPILDNDGIQVFKRQNEFLGLKPGVVFADIGASSGYYDAAMAVFVDSVTFYLNDIDHHCLNERNLNKVLRYYSKLKGRSIEATNPFHYVIGTPTRTNLPEDTFDVIFSNATMHVLNQPDSILLNLYRNLNANGVLYIRDEFVYNGEQKMCGSKKCGHYLLQYEPFLALMSRNGFVLVAESRDFGYPIYKFSKDLTKTQSSGH
jgi:SAM-dependent methyltransferase